MSTTTSTEVAGDELAAKYYKSEKGNVYTWLNLIKVPALAQDLVTVEANKSVEYVDTKGESRFFSKSGKNPDMIFVKTAEEQKKWNEQSKNFSGTRKATAQWDYFNLQLIPIDAANALMEKADFYLVDLPATSVIQTVTENGKMTKLIFVGQRKLRNPSAFATDGGDKKEEKK